MRFDVRGLFAASPAQLPKQREAESATGNQNHVSIKISCVLAANIALLKQGSEEKLLAALL